jgi:hypothetical protein
MGEEAYDEIEVASAREGDLRTLVIRGGYGREEVYLGICRTTDDQADEIISVDGRELIRVLRDMVKGSRK